MGLRSQQGLKAIALVAAGQSQIGITAAALYSNWRLELERVLLFEQADVTLLSYGTRSGAHKLRKVRHQRGRQQPLALGEEAGDCNGEHAKSIGFTNARGSSLERKFNDRVSGGIATVVPAPSFAATTSTTGVVRLSSMSRCNAEKCSRYSYRYN